MLRRVAVIRTDVSEERPSSGELGTTLAVTRNGSILPRRTSQKTAFFIVIAV
jgi:hypothetical protein